MSQPISFERSGEGPAVVLLHPTGLGPGPLDPLAQRLANHHLVVVPARRGYDASDGLPPPSSMADHLDDLAALLDHLGLASATFVGISGGATLVLALGIRHPDVVDQGLAHEPLIGDLAPELHAAVGAAIEQMLEMESPLAVSSFVAELIGIDTWNRLTPAWRTAVERNAPATRAEAPFYSAFSPTAAQLTALAGRGIVTSVGSRSGPLRQHAAAVLQSLGLPGATIEGASHLAHLEAPDAFVHLVETLPQQAEVPL